LSAANTFVPTATAADAVVNFFIKLLLDDPESCFIFNNWNGYKMVSYANDQ